MKVKNLFMKKMERAVEHDLAYREWCNNIAHPSTHVTPTPLNTSDYCPLKGA